MITHISQPRRSHPQAALNGDRRHDAVPRSPDAISLDAEAGVRAGAHCVHVRAFDAAGNETLDAADCGAAVRAIRARCPGTPLSLTTSAMTIADPIRRLEAILSAAGVNASTGSSWRRRIVWGRGPAGVRTGPQDQDRARRRIRSA
jgi:uncharacterized protein (DUF849 family)